MANLSKTKTEVLDDPIGRGYSAMSHQEVIDSIYTKDRPRDRTSMTASEVFNTFDISEFNLLADADQQKILNVLAFGTVNPFGKEQQLFVGVFGIGSTTIANLAEARVEMIHRVAELGLGDVRTGNIQRVRE